MLNDKHLTIREERIRRFEQLFLEFANIDDVNLKYLN